MTPKNNSQFDFSDTLQWPPNTTKVIKINPCINGRSCKVWKTALNPFTAMMSFENDNNNAKFQTLSLFVFKKKKVFALACGRIIMKTQTIESRCYRTEKCVRAYVRACVRACVWKTCYRTEKCVRASVRACVRACVRVCVCVKDRQTEGFISNNKISPDVA